MIPLGLYGAARPVAQTVSGPVLGGYATSGTDATSYTWTLNVGNAFADRHLFIAGVGNRGSSTAPFDMQADGVALTSLAQNAGWRRAIVTQPIAYPTGTTVDVTLNYGLPLLQAAACVWVLPSAPTVVDSSAALSTITLDTAADGWLLGIAYNTASIANTATDWTQTVEIMTATGFKAETTGAAFPLTHSNAIAAVSLGF